MLSQLLLVYSTLFLLALVFAAPAIQQTEDAASDDSEMMKRGGARSFSSNYYGQLYPKRLSSYPGLYFMDKRGGGRAFVPRAWDGYGIVGRMERRGGGRAFSGNWDAMNRFYDAPFYKRSSDMWNYYQGNDGFY